MRISTAYANKSALENLQKNSASLDTLTYQISSGNKAKRLQEIAGDANQLLNMKDISRNTGIYIKNINTAAARLNSAENALQDLNNLVTSAASLWTSARTENSPEVRATMAPQAEALVQNFYNLFQTQFDGRYIFSGQDGSTAPTSSTPTATAFAGNPAATTYYNGDTVRPQIVTAAGQTTTYGVTGNEAGFANLKAGLEALWYGLQNDSVVDIDGAISLLTTAQEDMSNMLGDVGGQINTMTMQKTRHETNTLFLQERIDDLDKVDIASAMTMFAQEQAAMEASMAVITRLSQLSLLNFLR